MSSCYIFQFKILFPVAYTGPKQSWNTSIRPSRTPYTTSLRTEHDFWKDLPRARCLACALKALTAANTPSPQSRQRPRPKSAPPRLSNQGQKARRSEYRPGSCSSTRKSLQPKASKSPKISPASCKEGPSSASSGSKKVPRVRSSYPKMSTPKSSNSVKKSLSFSPDTKEEETDSPPKPKGIRGGGRRRKAQLALMNKEELSTEDPRHAYYVLIHEDMKSGKPTASVKPIMSGDSEEAVGEEKVLKKEVETSDRSENVDIVVTDVGAEVTVVKEITSVGRDSEGDIAVRNDLANGVHDDHSGTVKVSEEVKVLPLDKNEATNTLPDEKPPSVSNNNTKTPPSEEKQAERDWSKPKPIRGRRKKPNADMNDNEPGKLEVKSNVSSKQDDVVNGGQELQQQKLVLTNGDS